MLNKFLIVLFASLAMTSAFAEQIVITNSYIPAAPPVVKVMAAYMTLENKSDKTVIINSFSSNKFGLIELHETIEKDGMMTMNQIPKLVILAKTKVDFKPGGKHLMLFQRDGNLTTGDKVVITLVTSVGKVSTTATVKDAAVGSHEHHHHH